MKHRIMSTQPDCPRLCQETTRDNLIVDSSVCKPRRSIPTVLTLFFYMTIRCFDCVLDPPLTNNAYPRVLCCQSHGQCTDSFRSGCLFCPAAVLRQALLSLIPSFLHEKPFTTSLQMTGSKTPAGFRKTFITMGKEGKDKKEKRKKKMSSLAILGPFPRASSLFSSSACRRSHFVRSSRGLLIICLFAAAFLPFWPPACLPCALSFDSSLVADNGWFWIVHSSSLLEA